MATYYHRLLHCNRLKTKILARVWFLISVFTRVQREQRTRTRHSREISWQQRIANFDDFLGFLNNVKYVRIEFDRFFASIAVKNMYEK